MKTVFENGHSKTNDRGIYAEIFQGIMNSEYLEQVPIKQTPRCLMAGSKGLAIP